MGLLQDKVVLVAGASRGIGKAVAVRLADEGARLVLSARGETQLRELADELGGGDQPPTVIPADISRVDEIERVVQQVLGALGRIDALVNCAGGAEESDWGDLIDILEDQWDRVIDLNLKGGFFLAQRVARAMREVGNGGSIVNLSSRSARIPNPGNGHFCAAKAGIESLTRSMALEWGGFGIRTNAIAPGLIATEGTAHIFESGLAPGKSGRLSPTLHRGTPEDIAALAAFLCSDESRYINGATVDINGGSAVPTAFIEYMNSLAKR